MQVLTPKNRVAMLVRNITLFNINPNLSQTSSLKKRNALPVTCADVFVKNPVQNHPSISFGCSAEKKILDDLRIIVADELSNPDALVKEVKKGFLEKIAKQLSQNGKQPLIIGVAGEPASGKTTVVDTIENNIKKLSDNKDELVTVIDEDSYYEDLTEQLKIYKNYSKLMDNGYDPHNPKTQHLELLREHLNSLKAGKEVAIPGYNFDTCESIPGQVGKKPTKIILCEGIFALNQKLKDLCDIKIYVDSPKKLIEERYLKRAILRGKDEVTARKLFSSLENSTQKYIRSSKDDADLVISGNSSEESVVNFVNRLFSAFKK